MRVRGERRAVRARVAGLENSSELLKRCRSTRPLIVIDDVRVIPLFELEELPHLGEHADSTLGWRCEHVVPRYSCEVSA